MDITLIISGNCFSEFRSPIPSLSKIRILGDKKGRQSSPYNFLLDRFKPINSEYNLPGAAITAMNDLEDARGKIWMRADPVFLHADLSSLILFDSQSFTISNQEMLEFFAIINPILSEDGLCLTCGDNPSRWYLQLNQCPVITAKSPGKVNGHDIHSALLSGPDQTYWRRLGNEIQMLLHDCPVNLERQRQGQPPINSVWFWGEGELPEPLSPQQLTNTKVISNDVNACGLARWSGVPHKDIPVDLAAYLKTQKNDNEILIVLSSGDVALSEADNQEAWLLEQEQLVFAPLMAALKKRQIGKIELVCNDFYGIIKRHHLYRFWRNWSIKPNHKPT